MVITGYVLLCLMGLTLGLMGAGGAILTVPILLYAFKIPILQATTYSLFVVGSTALIGIYRHRHFILFYKSLIFAIPSTLGVFIARHLILPQLPITLGSFKVASLITFAFVSLMGIASYLMIKDFKPHSRLHQTLSNKEIMQFIIWAWVLGLLMGILGAGGGFVIIPALVIFLSFDIKQAIGTSMLIIFLNSTVGFLSDAQALNSEDYIRLFNFTLLATIGMGVGSYYNDTISSVILKKIFGYLLALVALGMAVKEFWI